MGPGLDRLSPEPSIIGAASFTTTCEGKDYNVATTPQTALGALFQLDLTGIQVLVPSRGGSRKIMAVKVDPFGTSHAVARQRYYLSSP